MDDIRAELRKIPPVTRFMVLSSVAVSLPVMLHLLSGYKVVYTPRYVFGQAQIWRLWTSWFLGPSGVPFIFDMLMLYRASNELEETLFGGHSADYAWHLLVSAAVLNAPLGTLIFFRPLLHLLVYRAARAHPDAQVSLFGLIFVKNIYFPFVMLAMDLINGGPPALIQALTGVLTSHAWFMLLPDPGLLRSAPSGSGTSSGVRSFGGSSTYTLSGGGRPASASSTSRSTPGWRQYAVAPRWVRWLVGGMHEQGGSETRPWGTAIVPPRAGASQGGKSRGYNWGTGHRLGSE